MIGVVDWRFSSEIFLQGEAGEVHGVWLGFGGKVRANSNY